MDRTNCWRRRIPTIKLVQCGLEDLNLKPDHLLISFDSQKKLLLDATDKPEVRLCNFELVRRKPGYQSN